MEQQWQEVQQAQDQGAPTEELQGIYSAYLNALDGYNAAWENAEQSMGSHPAATSDED